MSVTTQTMAPREDLVAVRPAPGERPDRPQRPRRGRTLLAAVLVAVIVGAVGLLVWLALGGRASADGGLQLPDEREQVMSLTDQFAKRLGYSPDMVDDQGRMPQYRERMREILSPKFAAEFDEQVTAAEQIVAQARVTRTVDVFATAVSSIDDDSARVLIAGAFNDSYATGGTSAAGKSASVAQEPFPFRLVVDLVKIDGEWLVDDFTPAGADEGTGSVEGSAP